MRQVFAKGMSAVAAVSKKVAGAVVAGSAAVIAAPSFAQTSGTGTGPDFSTLTSSIDLSTVVTAVLAVAAIMVTVYVSIKGAKIVLSMLKGA